ncbi:NAD(P)/FAD-dependent oxidoreductase [Alloalcanivorax sp. C16-2]|uniref:NAD(P)/FAD-dependent oxidoreductase n=1 Tax=Alloalcanivorax sp. C16-2 TaxID=3390052 RepID=UPI0039710F18
MSADRGPMVIVGAGQAGLSVALALRAGGYQGTVIMIGAEPERPYERPALSKAALAGPAAESDDPAPALAEPEEWRALNLDARLGQRVRAIDRNRRLLHCDDQTTVAYGTLFLATGGEARRLPGVAGDRVHYLRTLGDARELRRGLANARRLLVAGGGWIGLEVAAAARHQGLEVTVLEAGTRLCERSLPEDAADYLLQHHQERGVRFRFGAVASPRASANGVCCEVDGTRLRADLMLVGIGLVPNDRLAVEAGLEVDDGIVVDGQARTSDPCIFAVGDVARFPSSFAGRRLRLESWTHARLQAEAAAAAALGGSAGYRDQPWFWSDQHDLNVQVLGLPRGRGICRDYGTGRRGLFYFHEGALTGAVAFNAGRDIGFARRWLNAGRSPRAEDLADTGLALSALHRHLREVADEA